MGDIMICQITCEVERCRSDIPYIACCHWRLAAGGEGSHGMGKVLRQIFILTVLYLVIAATRCHLIGSRWSKRCRGVGLTLALLCCPPNTPLSAQYLALLTVKRENST